MRNFAVIGLILLLLFNIVGYQGLFVGLQYRNDQRIEQFADRDQFDGELMTLKIPLALPYPSSNKAFERTNRKFEFQGEHYRLLKQKLTQDTLYIVCYKDRDSKKIAAALSDVVKTFTDQNSDKHLSSFLKEYLSSTFEIESLTDGWSLELLLHDIQCNVMAIELVAPYGPPRT